MELGRSITLKVLRMERGLTQKQCAYYAGVTRQTYVNWEGSACVIPADKFKKLADYFGIPLDELFIACFGNTENEGNNGT